DLDPAVQPAACPVLRPDTSIEVRVGGQQVLAEGRVIPWTVAAALAPHLPGLKEAVLCDPRRSVKVAALADKRLDRAGQLIQLIDNLLSTGWLDETPSLAQPLEPVQGPEQDPRSLWQQTIEQRRVFLAQPTLLQLQQQHSRDQGAAGVVEPGQLVA